MAQEPKRRHSKQRKGKRRASIHLAVPRIATCPNCGGKHAFHSICPQCGFYKGTQVMTVKNKTKTNEQTA